DREPAVMLALERARMQVLMQAYLQKKIGKGNRPSSAEMESFYQANPDLFARRKQFDLNELVIDSKNVSPEFKEFTAKANSLDQVASWLDDKKIPYTPIEVMPTTADIPAVMIKTMNTMQKGQIFTANDSTRTLVIALRDVKDAPVSQAASMPKIEQYLLNKNIKEAGEVELARLRASAKIEYINAAFINKNQPRNQTADAAPVAAPMTGKTAASTHIDRGVAGLK
ncbi:MAG: peptidyl-prolyl cis-trans isomerase, partial [Burkholderiaceae bacterium]